MPSREELKAQVRRAIDSAGEEIVGVAQAILRHPEPGFREVKTSKLVAERLAALGIPHQTGIALTGVKGEVRCGSPGPSVAVLGELDSLIVSTHPYADPTTGAAHACGHHAQIGMLLGVAYALARSDVARHLAGRVVLIAVPAEEYIEIEYREGLREQGKVEFLGGKPEFIRLGALDDVHMAMMVHTTSNPEEKLLALSGTNNGIVAKQVHFTGRAAHAGSSPHLGVNALNAAMLALAAIHANRETFRDDDTVRVHPIITKGGEAVSSVPADVRLETFVRGRTVEAFTDASAKVDRALRAGAMAVGAKVRIKTLPGYLPLRNDPNFAAVFRQNAVALVGEENVAQITHRTGSTDMGDVSQIMPAIHPYAGGARGIGHGADYVVQDWERAVLNPARCMAMTLVDLLADGAKLAGEIRAKHRPAMTKEEYLRFMRSLFSDVTYEE